jgi:hypothetical protein
MLYNMTSVIFLRNRVVNNDLLCQVKLFASLLTPLHTSRKTLLDSYSGESKGLSGAGGDGSNNQLQLVAGHYPLV